MPGAKAIGYGYYIAPSYSLPLPIKGLHLHRIGTLAAVGLQRAHVETVSARARATCLAIETERTNFGTYHGLAACERTCIEIR